jgi:PIN domain nuclease of toxin-antitoxin system
VNALLDTHILLWWLEAQGKLSKGQEDIIEQAGAEHPLLISNITLWEIATLNKLGRIRLRLPLRDWLERAAAPPLVERVAISPAVAAEVAALPPGFHRDPADRIIIATARVRGATLLTCDQRIVASGIVPTVS